MLDVHPPHAAAHSWKDFFIHIATIVIGLLIAIGLEQTVEFFHHRHQAHQLEAALDQEIAHNRAILRMEIGIMDEAIAAQERNKASLERAKATNGREPFVYAAFDPSAGWSMPADSAWADARDDGLFSLLPPARAQYLSRLDAQLQTCIELTHQLFDAEYSMLASAHLRANPVDLAPAERDAMLLSISQYEETAQHLRMQMSRTLLFFDQNNPER